MKYSVVILPTAENDLDRILLWLNERSPLGALTWLKRWEEVVLTLAHDPDRCGIAPESITQLPFAKLSSELEKGTHIEPCLPSKTIVCS